MKSVSGGCLVPKSSSLMSTAKEEGEGVERYMMASACASAPGVVDIAI